MKAILYTDTCTPCTNRPLWKQLQSKAAEKKSLLQRKDVRKDLIALDEANSVYGRAIPFIVLDGKDMSVEEFLSA